VSGLPRICLKKKKEEERKSEELGTYRRALWGSDSASEVARARRQGEVRKEEGGS